MDNVIYLDHAATTPVDPEVAAGVCHAMTETFGNPSSRHAVGLTAERALRSARADLAKTLDVQPDQLTFTSGGTEAIALAVLGSARRRRKPGRLLLSRLEHPAVRKTADLAAEQGHQRQQREGD